MLSERLEDPKLIFFFTVMSRQEARNSWSYKRMLEQQPSRPTPADAETPVFDFRSMKCLNSHQRRITALIKAPLRASS